MLKTIKRKNAINNVNQEDLKGDELLENYKNELSGKKLNKQGLEKILVNFNKHLETCTEKQKALEQRQEELEKKSQEYYIQNQKLICEVASRK